MIMAPVPVGLLIPGAKLVKIIVLAMILLGPHPVRLVLTTIPFMVVIVPRVVISVSILLVLALILLFLPLVVPTVVLSIYGGGNR
jgi:hypothetical protein